MKVVPLLYPYQVHIIEDKQADFLALQRAVSQAANRLDSKVDFTRHSSSQEAFQALLAGERPDLMFVDIHLAAESGLEFLRRVKKEPRISPCPKIILTTSTAESDVLDSYSEGAAGYLVKPLQHSALTEAVHTCREYWFVASRRPSPYIERDDLQGGLPIPPC